MLESCDSSFLSQLEMAILRNSTANIKKSNISIFQLSLEQESFLLKSRKDFIKSLGSGTCSFKAKMLQILLWMKPGSQQNL